jgi:hypothetical protein
LENGKSGEKSHNEGESVGRDKILEHQHEDFPPRQHSPFVATPLLEECEDDTHTPEMGTWESSMTPKTSEFDCRGQNTSP